MNPIQPLMVDAQGTLRFKKNSIVCFLLDLATSSGIGLNELSRMNFSDDDFRQFAQLIGYSLSGYSELHAYVSDEDYRTAAHMAQGMDERDARIAALEQKLSELRAAADMLRDPVAIGASAAAYGRRDRRGNAQLMENK